jgi:hypothetical protein
VTPASVHIDPTRLESRRAEPPPRLRRRSLPRFGGSCRATPGPVQMPRRTTLATAATSLGLARRPHSGRPGQTGPFRPGAAGRNLALPEQGTATPTHTHVSTSRRTPRRRWQADPSLEADPQSQCIIRACGTGAGPCGRLPRQENARGVLSRR